MRHLKHFLIMLLLVHTGCSEVTGKMAFLGNLQQEITDKYDSEEVDIHPNNNRLEVILKDAQFKNYTGREKQKIAYQIGKMANNLRESDPKIKNGVVNFVDERNALMVKSSTSDSYQMFP